MQGIFERKYHLLLFLIIISLSFPEPSNSQNNNAQAAFYNIGIGSVFSGMGAVINKKPEEKFWKVLLKGMAQGALGGYLVYESKNLISRIPKHEKLEYAWPAKLVNSAGISIIENAASNRDFWEQYNLNIGFNRIEFHTQDKFRIKYRIMPAAMLLTAFTAFGNKFEVERSLRSGEFIFSAREVYNQRYNQHMGGYAVGTSTVIRSDLLDNFRIFAHEFIHIYQYYDFNVFNAHVKIPLDVLKKESGFFRTMDKIFHYDFQYPFRTSLNMIQNWDDKTIFERYENNIFEIEADYYSDKF